MVVTSLLQCFLWLLRNVPAIHGKAVVFNTKAMSSRCSLVLQDQVRTISTIVHQRPELTTVFAAVAKQPDWATPLLTQHHRFLQDALQRALVPFN